MISCSRRFADAMSLPRLSPELYDRIIDEVAESVTRSRKDTTLSALALTCREWLPRVRYNRWNRVAWLSDLRERRLLALVTLIHAVPEIAPYIKTMELAIKAYVRRPYRKREAAGQSIFVIGPMDDPHAPVGLDATIRKNATSEEICQAFFPKLINLVYLEFNSPILPVTPRLVCHLSKLRVLVLVRAILRSWQNLQECCGRSQIYEKSSSWNLRMPETAICHRNPASSKRSRRPPTWTTLPRIWMR